MHGLLKQLLDKKGLKPQDLRDGEIATIKKWEKRLEGKSVTDKDIIRWLEKQKNEASDLIIDPKVSEKEKIIAGCEARIARGIINILKLGYQATNQTKKQIQEQINKG